MRKFNRLMFGRRRFFIPAVTLFLFFAMQLCGASTVGAQAPVAVMLDYFDIGTFGPGVGSDTSEGIAFIPSTGDYAIIDSTNLDEKVFIVNSSGILQSQFDLTYNLNPNPSGITYITTGSLAGNFAVVDDTADDIFIIDSSGVLQSQCDISGKSTSPQGIAYDPSTGYFAVVDNSADEVFFFDTACVFQFQFDTSGFSGSPGGVTYIDTGSFAGNFAIVDRGTPREVSIVTPAGVVQHQFSAVFVSTSPIGIVFNPNTENFAIVDNNSDEVFSLNGEGSLAGGFQTSIFGSFAPKSISFIPTSGNFAVVDDGEDEVYIVNSSGTLQDQCDISAFSGAARGITYISSGTYAGKFAIVDATLLELFIIDMEDPVCSVVDQFDIGTFGISSVNPTGVVYLPDERSFVITDANRDAAFILDPSRPGRLRSQASTSAFTSTSPQGIALLSDTGNAAFVDNSLDEVFITNSDGIILARFDTAPFSSNPQGIAFDVANELLVILDGTSLNVTFVDLPSLASLPEGCTCDLDGSGGQCNFFDWLIFIESWGRTDCP
jgi:DNA-binding beta-propeller fold protein YncE